MTKDEILETVEALRSIIATGKDKLADGQYLEMELMQTKIDEICQEIAELTPEEAEEVREPLKDFLEDLQTYSSHIDGMANTADSDTTVTADKE
ncbi:MAG: hypothetical protein CMP14_07995 [Rickettsiales bacterium]|jgi:ABC-type Zn uptake system ZnuABC Zn-binding protein ZnuA|nr:hypothetical protein [Rickettsiales bacterium]|tara:strand:- start:2166 stop:2447 length:282 start_codon:yes stop_codon:yes gene_type:complete